MDLETVTGVVRAIVVALDGRLPATDVQNAWSLLDAGEAAYGFAERVAPYVMGGR
ncbi:hypothetical protein JOD67_005775 [Tenggerimyces flavus]|nr:hypothetical protein [Tenggerimyces flavus]